MVNEEVKSVAEGALSLDITNTPLFIESAEADIVTPATDFHHYAVRFWLGGDI